jgi:hypothetical protein
LIEYLTLSALFLYAFSSTKRVGNCAEAYGLAILILIRNPLSSVSLVIKDAFEVAKLLCI